MACHADGEAAAMKRDAHPPVARLEHVGQRFGTTVALNDITLTIPSRCMVGLIGPDGAGKSSLLSLIAGARVIEQGNVMVLGGDMRDARHRRDVCPKIAWMPQGLGTGMLFTDNVPMPLEIRKDCLWYVADGD